MLSSQFLKNFHALSAPEALLQLLDFDTHVASRSYFAPGFEFKSPGPKFLLETFSKDERFLNHLHEFAQADASGSMYALWQQEGTNDPEHSPIAVFGSEGGYHIVADNAREWLELLAADAEPMCSWEHVSYYRDPAEEASPLHAEYREWLRTNFAIERVRAANEIVSTAQKKHQQAFAEWMKNFVD